MTETQSAVYAVLDALFDANERTLEAVDTSDVLAAITAALVTQARSASALGTLVRVLAEGVEVTPGRLRDLTQLTEELLASDA